MNIKDANYEALWGAAGGPVTSASVYITGWKLGMGLGMEMGMGQINHYRTSLALFSLGTTSWCVLAVQDAPQVTRS